MKNYFFALFKFGAFGVILTMQLEPPKSKGLRNLTLTQALIHTCEKCVTLTNTQPNGNHEQPLTHKLKQSSRVNGVGHCMGIGPCKNATTINNSNNTPCLRIHIQKQNILP